ncbi:MAG: hypothetical protein ACE5LU_26790 [Anaerolineae bacterium]
MSIIAWITAAFGALVVGVATSSVLDELLDRVVKVQLDRWSQESILRIAITITATIAAMALWVWLWMRYVVG